MNTLPQPESQLVAGLTLQLALRTDTKVDVGRWWRRARLWVATTNQELLLVAAGPRPHFERVPLTTVCASLYNAVTSEVILTPAPGVQQRELQLAPLEAHQLLVQIQQKETSPC